MRVRMQRLPVGGMSERVRLACPKEPPQPAHWHVLFRNASFVSTLRYVALCFFLEPEAVMGYAFAYPTPPKAVVMRVELSQALPPGRVSPVVGLLVRLLLFTTVALSGCPARASEVAEDPKSVQQQPSHDNGPPEDNHDTKPSKEPAAPLTPPSLCDALGAAAVANELPVDFFTRLIWQESRFKPEAISRKGAQGIAQFMPATARASGLENPFNALDAITKSGAMKMGVGRRPTNAGCWTRAASSRSSIVPYTGIMPIETSSPARLTS